MEEVSAMTYVQAVPLYLRDDRGATEYFANHQDEISAITGRTLTINLPKSVVEGQAREIISAVGSDRYPGLKNSDLPCLWVEDSNHHFILKLPDNHNAIRDLLRLFTDEIEDALKNGQGLAHVERMVMEKTKPPTNPPNPPNPSSIPPWLAKAGAFFGGVTLLFFMGLIGVSILHFEVPPSATPLVIIVVALSMALSLAFIGGSAAAEGKIPIPYVKDNPVGFSVSGGIAVFVIVLVISFWLFGTPPGKTNTNELTEEERDQIVRAENRFDQKEYRECVRLLKPVVEKHKSIASLRKLNGTCLSLVPERRQEAIDELLAASSLDPKDADTEFNLATIYRDIDDSGKAREHASEALHRDPHLSRAQMFLGQLAEKDKEWEKAIQYYTRVIEGHGEYAEWAHLKRANALIMINSDNKSVDSAVADIIKGMQKAQDNDQAKTYLAEVCNAVTDKGNPFSVVGKNKLFKEFIKTKKNLAPQLSCSAA